MTTTPAIDINSIDDTRIEQLVSGAIDLHCHSGPSVMARYLDHIEAMQEASAAGLKAVFLKDHYYSVTPVTQLLNKHFHHLGVLMLSGVPLNNAVGGLNVHAVEHGLKLGQSLCGCQLFHRPTTSATTSRMPTSRTSSHKLVKR